MGLAGKRIAVIGAGIGGLAAARALAARQAEVTVFEQAASLGEVGAGIQVGPNGVAVLEALGLRDASERQASLPQAIELRSAGGGTVAAMPLGHECVARYGRPYWHFHRADLLAVLIGGLLETGVHLRLGRRVRDIADTGGGVRLSGDDGGFGDFDAVIAADGVRSETRTARFGGEPPRFTGHVAWRGLVDAARLGAGAFPDAACVTMGAGRHLVTYPLRGGALINFVAVETRADWTAEGWTAPDDPANLRRAFVGWSGAVPALLREVDETYLWGLFDHRPLARWTRGPVALLGDACHPMLPFLAQGATMALEDAWVLAAELDVADSIERGLVAYEARRLPRTARVQRAAARNGWMFHAGGARRVALDLGLRAASRVAPGLLLGRFDWLYGADLVSARATA